MYKAPGQFLGEEVKKMEKIAIPYEAIGNDPLPYFILKQYHLTGDDTNSKLYDLLMKEWREKEKNLFPTKDSGSFHANDKLKESCDGRKDFLKLLGNQTFAELELIPIPKFMPLLLAYTELLFEDLHQRAAHPGMNTFSVENDLNCIKKTLSVLYKYRNEGYIGFIDEPLRKYLAKSLEGTSGQGVKMGILRKIPPEFKYSSFDNQWALKFCFKDRILQRCFVAVKLREAEPANLKIIWDGNELVCFHLDNITSKEALGKFAKLIEHKPEEKK